MSELAATLITMAAAAIIRYLEKRYSKDNRQQTVSEEKKE